jgi:hypothetical protein
VPNSRRYSWARFCGLVTIFVIAVQSYDGANSSAAALDRWVGTVSNGVRFLNFEVLVDPGNGASFQWRGQGNVLVASGPLSASVSGSRVDGTLFTTGGLIFVPGECCRPCNFSGTITGNRVDGTLDPISCTDDGSALVFTLVKQ